MVNCLMFVSETPNKSKASGFAATKRWSPFVTTIASGELANNFRKLFSLSRSASCNLRGFSATLSANIESVFCARRSHTLTLIRSAEPNLVIVPFVTRIASRELASNFRKSFFSARSARCSFRVLSATLSPNIESVFCARRRCTVTCSSLINSCDLTVVICISRWSFGDLHSKWSCGPGVT